MSFIDDMKIGKKLIGGFLIVVLILVVVTAIGYIKMGDMDAADTSMYVDRAVPLGQLGTSEGTFYQLRGDLYKSVLIPEEKDSALTNALAEIAVVDKEMAAYGASSMAADEKAEYEKFKVSWAGYKAESAVIMDLIRKGDTKQAIEKMKVDGKLSTFRKEVDAELSAMSDINVNGAKTLSDSNTGLYNSSSMMLIIATIIGAIIAVVLALYMSCLLYTSDAADE